ncbi:MAG: hypothetical protein JWR00_4589, partial [Rubritepida sp.]|nr:hypothetical protein [Rubritepida sp.]
SGSEERYAGLSSAEVADLRAGRGMGLALPAELNGYPGPVHVLELTDALRLSPAQRETMLRLVAAMRAEVIPLGEQLIAGERVLDEVFVSGSASFASLNAAVAAAADARGALRAAHLRVHLEARDALTDVQRTAYARLRGYTPG